MRTVTLCYVRDKGKVLLGMKKIRFGAGYLNGFGGKVEVGESIVEAACREVLEECGLSIHPNDVIKKAELRFSFIDKPEYAQEMHVFVADKFRGTPHHSDEMTVDWYLVDEKLFDKMWPSDKEWVPLVLNDNKNIKGSVTFSGTKKPFTITESHFEETGEF